jgi:ferritin-like metal-binding protein YciE
VAQDPKQSIVLHLIFMPSPDHVLGALLARRRITMLIPERMSPRLEVIGSACLPVPLGKFRSGSEPSLLPGFSLLSSNLRSNAMVSESSLRELFHETLKDIYFAEKKILGALPKMAKAAHSKDLKAAFEKHETETEEHIARLEKVFEEIEEAARGKTCDAIMGIIEEGQEVMKEFKGEPALDAGLLAAAQAVEHYEIARYPPPSSRFWPPARESSSGPMARRASAPRRCASRWPSLLKAASVAPPSLSHVGHHRCGQRCRCFKEPAWDS